MKKIKIIFVWTLIALFLSVGVLFFVDKIYLSSAKTFEINKSRRRRKENKKGCFNRCTRLCRKHKSIF